MADDNPTGPNGDGHDPSRRYQPIVDAVNAFHTLYGAARSSDAVHNRKTLFWSRWTCVFVAAYTIMTTAIVCAAIYSAKQVQIGSEAARQTVQIARDTQLAQLRAYISWDHDLIELTSDSEYRVSMSIKNGGETPAYSTRYFWDSKVLDLGPNAPTNVRSSVIPLAPPTGQDNFDINPRSMWPIAMTRAISPDDLAAVKSGSKAIYVWGKVDYRDFRERTQENCQIMEFLVRSSPEITQGKSSFHPVQIDNSVTSGLPCVPGADGVLRAKYPW
jgi:hypothetical protein